MNYHRANLPDDSGAKAGNVIPAAQAVPVARTALPGSQNHPRGGGVKVLSGPSDGENKRHFQA